MEQSEFEELLADTSKRIESEIMWSEDEDHSPAFEFTAEVESDAGYPIFVRGSINMLAQTLTFAVTHKANGGRRIYALDLGKQHRNPDGQLIGEKHKHRWNQPFKDKEAYVPPDITAGVDDPVAVWQQFCAEAKIAHKNTMHKPPALQEPLL